VYLIYNNKDKIQVYDLFGLTKAKMVVRANIFGSLLSVTGFLEKILI